jgi:hypothetical protein
MRRAAWTIAGMVALAGCLGAQVQEETGPSPAPSKPLRTSISDERSALPPDYENISRLWKNRTEVTVMDKTVQWHEEGNPVLQLFRTAVQPVANPCVWQPRNVYFTNRGLSFDNVTQLVFPGTEAISVRFDWEMTSSLTERVVLAYRPNRSADFKMTPYIRKGTTYEFSLQPGEWDHGSQGRTQWEFWACVSRSGGEWGAFFIGELDVKMKLLRGHA